MIEITTEPPIVIEVLPTPEITLVVSSNIISVEIKKQNHQFLR